LTATPLVWLVVGPNGAGKTTYYETRIRPRLNIEFVNADQIAAERWPRSAARHSRDAAIAAQQRREELFELRRSFATETVCSHPGRLEILTKGRRLGYEVWVTFVCVGRADLAVARVAERVLRGGHDIPAEKVRSRYRRLIPLATRAVLSADRGLVVDNSTHSAPLRDVLTFERGTVTFVTPDLPRWAARAFASPLRRGAR
jgi:predicted ABC-type ATPase